MTDLFTRHRPEIICGIITTLLCVYFLQPLVDLLGRLSLGGMALVSKALLNQFYSEIATLETNDHAFTLSLFYLMLPTLAVGLVFASKGIRLLIVAANAPSQNASNEARPAQAAPESPQAPRIAQRGIGNFAFGSLVIIFGLGLICAALFLVGYGNEQLRAVTSFQQHLRILAPYLDEAQEEQLVAQWSRMQSRDDYVRIRSQLNSIAQRNSVELPHNRLYPFGLD